MPLVVAVDFDGTLVENRFPGIGPPVPGGATTLRALQKQHGILLILWTCRTGHHLSDAVGWCRKAGLVLWGVNARPGKGGPKVLADVYVDERALCPTDLDGRGRKRVVWAHIRPELERLAREASGAATNQV